VIGAALLGVAAIAPTVIQLAIGHFGFQWLELVRICINIETWSFSLLLCVVLADEQVDRNANPFVAYGSAVVLAAVLGTLMGLAQSHFVWDAILNPPALLKAKTEINPWVVYTHHFYIVIETVLIGSLATYLYVDRREARKMAQRLHEAGLRRGDQAKSMLESQLQAMQARVEPQFLFNTLAQVGGLYEQDPKLAERMLGDLIAYLHAAMPHMRDTSSTLAQEIDLARAYLDIVKVRLGDRLAFDIELPEGAADTRMPPMMLLPLIDHAVVHGLANKPQKSASMHIACAIADGRLRLTIADSGAGFLPDAGGDGITTIRERLAALYGSDASLVLRRCGAASTEAVMKIPCESPKAFEPAKYRVT